MKKSFSLVYCILLPTFVFAQIPDWVQNLGASEQYPQALYLTGFGIAKLGADKDRARCLKSAEEHARSNVAQSLSVQIQSVIIAKSSEQNQKLSQYFSATTQSQSSLKIQGLQLENYYSEKEKCAYCLAHVRREQLQTLYGEMASALNKEIKNTQQAAQQAEYAKDYTAALEAYLSCYPLFNQMAEAQMILTAAANHADKVFSELQNAGAPTEVTMADIRDAVARLLKRPINHIDDLAWHLAYCLKEQAPKEMRSIQVTPFVFQDSKMVSPFARYFKEILEHQLVEVNRWRLVAQAVEVSGNSRGSAIEYAAMPQTEYVLTGSYWIREDSAQILSAIRQIKAGRIAAVMDVAVPLSILHNSGRDLTPQNFSQAAQDQHIFSDGELIADGLQLEAWTNKGTESVLYTDGEQMKVYVRINVPCYLRFVYHLADGRRTLLLSSYFLDESKVNKVYEIPEDFYCDQPFGAETLQIFASTEPFVQPSTVERDGYLVLADDLHTFVSGTRGMKKAQNKRHLLAEKRIVITTMAR